MAAFMLHYFYRDLIFPLRLRGGKPTPFVVWAMAAVFCVYNGYMQVRSHHLVQLQPSWVFFLSFSSLSASLLRLCFIVDTFTCPTHILCLYILFFILL
jgi:hypothetical protein